MERDREQLPPSADERQRRANEARKYLQARGLDAWLPLGVLGSMVSWGLVNVFHASIVRGTGLVLALLCALSVVALDRADDGEQVPEGSGRDAKDAK